MARLLSKSYKRTQGYAVGGITTLIAINTRENGKKTLTITRTGAVITDIALAVGATVKPRLLEAEPGEAAFTQPTQIGANRFLKPTIALKFGGYSDQLSEMAEVFDLDKTTFAIELAGGIKLLVGEQNGLTAEATSSNAGGKSEDFAGLDTTLSGAEIKRAAIITDEAWDDLLALVPAEV